MASVFIKVPVSERLPSESGIYTTNKGAVHFLSVCKRWAGCEPQWFLEEIELPTEEEVFKSSTGWKEETRQECYIIGASFVLSKLKGGIK